MNKPEYIKELNSQFYVEIVGIHGKRIDLILIPKIDENMANIFDQLIPTSQGVK